MPSTLLPRRWALTPPFHPYPHRVLFEDVPKVFLRAITGLRAAGGIFSVALSVNSSTGFSQCFFLGGVFLAASRRSITDSSLCYRPPGVTRRIALHPQALRPKGILCSRRVVSGLSSRPVRLRVPGQRSSSPPAIPIIPRATSSGMALLRNCPRHRITPCATAKPRIFLCSRLPRNGANISSRRSSRHQPVFAHVVPLRQESRHAARGAGTSRQIYSELEPLVQHTPQLLFLLALLFGIFPRLFPDSSDFCNVSFNQPRRLDEKSRVAKQLFDPQQLLEFAFRQHRHSQFFRLVVLRSRVCAHYHIVRLLAH